MYQDKNTAEEDIAGCIDLIIHLSRLETGRIVVDSIHEVCSDLSWKEPIHGDLGLPENDCDLKESELLRILLMRLGVRYIGSLLAGKSYYLKPIFRFNKTLGESGAWELVEAPSDQYFQKMSRYAGDPVYRADLEAVSVKGANTRKWIGCFLLFYYREAFAAVFFLFPAGFFSDAVKSGMAGFPLPYFWSGMRIASTGFFPEAKAL